MLTTEFLNLTFPNPLVLASGIRGVSASSMQLMVKNGCGGVTLKSVSLNARVGHENPTIVTEHFYLLNAIGLSNPGVAAINEEIAKFKTNNHTTPLIASIFAGNAADLLKTALAVDLDKIDLLEINLSCPNVGSEFGEPFAYSPNAVATITKQLKQHIKVPISIKLSPQAWNIATIAKAAEDNGADAITAVNTISGMAIDINVAKPILQNLTGGISGPALFPLALRCVYEIYRAVKIPIIGTGGITTGQEAIAMLMAGATLLGIGSAVYYRGINVFAKINREIEEFMRQNKVHSLAELIGKAHQ